ncbi:quinate 5-dehydrogenase [Geosporobacter ferrireducens]|uniref:Quinate 5-dehydrogenase n=1 Tax=Geosporobacter ferrireducens TaxID=1424294 RepID=A0A1D8GJK2_9FIRM|nr:quinate 5-dehydrogenase [Geosporobacter ferrireducens]AOT71090.1 quinate 5-dehydrogenase [Geosporobacter ferrireducens]MTI58235.1 quinate 5-dehydrogenase [Geosporobacter ferrireducens]
MKHIVSVSIGSTERNHRAEVDLLGEQFIIERIGTNGDIEKAIKILKTLDGKVDAFGMGGIDLYIYVGSKRYTIKDALPLREAVRYTPIVDGSGLKNTLERNVIEYLEKQKLIDFSGKKVLMVSAADRFGMAQALEAAGCTLTCGDLMFSLGIPYPVKSLKLFYRIAGIIAPIAVKMPFHLLYPTGKEQHKNEIYKYEQYYHESDIIAGDFHYIHRFMPKRLENKIVITNTVTSQDIEEMRSRGVETLITTTPEFKGRSFGTNVMEAIIITCIGKNTSEVTEADYKNMIRKLALEPRIISLQEKDSITELR